MSRQDILKKISMLMFASAVTMTLVACGNNDEAASGESVAERLKPVGTVNVEGKPAPAAVTETAPAAEPAPAAEAPAPAAAASAAPNGEAVYQKACLACHMVGVAGAPKLGDKAAWEPRVAKGMAVLLQATINGVPNTAMPARGSCATCSDEELKAAIEYMIGQ